MKVSAISFSAPRPGLWKSQLDWFHIGMKLELLRKAVAMPSATKNILMIHLPSTQYKAASRGYATHFGEVDHGRR
jgi:hypothetical protein